MNKKLIDLLNEEDILDEATQAALYEEEQLFQQRAAQAEGKEIGEDIGKKIGIFQGKLEDVHKLVHSFYGKQADWLDDCSLQQLEKAFQLAIDKTDYKQLKQEVLRQ